MNAETLCGMMLKAQEQSYGDGLDETPTTAGTYSATEGGSGTHLTISALVANDVLKLDDSKGGKQEVYVKGRVFAYVWKDITVTMDKTKEPKAFQYFQLLFDARRKVSEDFHKDDRIYKENILQFSTDMGKIKMVIHYTLIKDITTP